MAATNVQAFSGDLDIAGAITSNLEVGTANLFVDTVNSRVGIGTTIIDITDNTLSGAGAGLFIHNAVEGGHLLTLGTQRPWVFEQGLSGSSAELCLRSLNSGKKFNIQSPDYSNVMTIKATDGGGGGVGIGTNNPTRPLHIQRTSENSANQIGLVLSDDQGGNSTTTLPAIGFSHSNGTIFRGGIQMVGESSNLEKGMIFRCGGSGYSAVSLSSIPERMRINRNGRVGINSSSPQDTLDVRGNSRVTGGSSGSLLYFRNYGSVSRIYSTNYGAGIHLTGGAVYPADRVGNVGSSININLGASGNRWNVIYAKSSLNTSDLNLKRDVVDVNQTEKRVAKRITNNIKTFRWKESYERKGEEARLHTGVIAQEVEQAFRDEGLDPFRYGLLARGDHYEVNGDTKLYDKDGEWTGLFVDADTPGAVKVKDTYHMQYSELLCFIVSGMSDRLDSLETQLASVLARLDALESA